MIESSLTHIWSGLTIVIGLVGLLALIREYRRSNAIKRAEFVSKMIEKFRGDPDIRDLMYEFQYNAFHYDVHFHDNDDYERRVDKALYYLSYICYLEQNGVIIGKDFCFFEIEVQQALRCDNLIDYLFNLYHFECHSAGFDPFDEKSERHFTFYNLLKYARESGLVDRSFYDPRSADSGLYHQYLIF